VSVSPQYLESRCTKLDIQMFHEESWKPVYFEVRKSRSQVTKRLPAWVFAVLRLLASGFYHVSANSIEFGSPKLLTVCGTPVQVQARLRLSWYPSWHSSTRMVLKWTTLLQWSLL